MEIAVLVLGGLGTLVALFATRVGSRHPYGALWIGGVAACFYVFTICAGIHARWVQQDAAASPKTGEMLKGQIRQEMPDGESRQLAVRLGNNSAISEGDSVTFVGQGDDDLLAVARKDGRLFVSGKLYDPFDNVACEIVDNIYTLKSDNFKVSNGPYRFALQDSTGNEIMSLELIDRKTLKLTGDIVGRHGHRAEIRENYAVIGGIRMSESTINLTGGSRRVAIALPE